jgi:hypothetical protein
MTLSPPASAKVACEYDVAAIGRPAGQIVRLCGQHFYRAILEVEDAQPIVVFAPGPINHFLAVGRKILGQFGQCESPLST